VVKSLPREWSLGVRVAPAIIQVLVRERSLELRIALGPVRVRPEEIPKQQRQLLAEAAGAPDVDVRATVAGRLSEIPLGPLGVFGAKDVVELLERTSEGGERLEIRDGDLDVDDRLAARPTTAVEPMWSIRRATSRISVRIARARSSKSRGHSRS
jgi:hypothetical protein